MHLSSNVIAPRIGIRVHLDGLDPFFSFSMKTGKSGLIRAAVTEKSSCRIRRLVTIPVLVDEGVIPSPQFRRIVTNMFDFLTKDYGLKDQYTVLVGENGKAYLYASFAFSHEEAMWRAVVQHLDEGFSSSIGTRYLVDGPCHEPACDCDGIHQYVQVGDSEIVRA